MEILHFSVSNQILHQKTHFHKFRVFWLQNGGFSFFHYEPNTWHMILYFCFDPLVKKVNVYSRKTKFGIFLEFLESPCSMLSKPSSLQRIIPEISVIPAVDTFWECKLQGIIPAFSVTPGVGGRWLNVCAIYTISQCSQRCKKLWTPW